MGWRGTCLQMLGFPLAWFAFLYWKQDSLIYHPRRYRPGGGQKDVQVKNGLVGKWLHFRTMEGNQSALLMRPKASKTSRVYLVFGGNAMVATDWLDILSQSFGVAPNIAFMLVDYPGYGYSEGAPSQSSIRHTSVQALLLANAMLSSSSSDELEFGAMGHSIGCAAAFQLAAAMHGSNQALRHLVLSAPFTNIAEMAQEVFTPLKAISTAIIKPLTSRNEWDNLAAASKLAGDQAPRIDIIHGLQDSIVPFAQGKALVTHLNKLNVPVEFKEVTADHNDLLGLEVYWDWLQRVLRQ